MRHLFTLAVVAAFTTIAAPGADARNWDRVENRFDRAENRLDRRENRFDRREDVRDAREDVRDTQHQGGRRDRGEDVRDAREDVRPFQLAPGWKYSRGPASADSSRAEASLTLPMASQLLPSLVEYHQLPTLVLVAVTAMP